MLKLWIVHPSSRNRAALARICGVAPNAHFAGAPMDPEFDEAPAPALVLLALEGDFEQELEFAHRHRTRLREAKWLILCQPADALEAARLFESVAPEVLSEPPTARLLRARVSAAVAHRSAESLDQRRVRARVAERFSAWLGGIEVPGLLRALDPSLAAMPMLVRGVSGSGRSLLCRYVELFRGGTGPTLRLHAREIESAERLAKRLRSERTAQGHPIGAIWIDEIDTLSVSVQRALAEWILHDTPPEGAPGDPLRWLATAGPGDLGDELDPGLELAFSPLTLTVPSLGNHPDSLRRFADEVVQSWTRRVGGPPREIGQSAIELLESQPWAADRAEIEAVLRASLAGSTRPVIEEQDLRFPTDVSIGSVDSLTPEASETALDLETAHPGQAPTSLDGPIDGPTRDPIESEPDEVPTVEAEALTEPNATVFETAFLEAAPGPISSIFDEVLEEPEAPRSTAEAVGPATAEARPTEGLETPAREPEAPIDESVLLSESAFALASETPDAIPAALAEHLAEQNDGWRRLARSLSHEIRNPLVSIRTFTELLPEHFQDETFRQRFTELVGRDVAHIDDVIARLATVAEREKLEPEAVDVSALIEELLEARREQIGQGRLLVLRELERDAPLAWADGHCLQVALSGLLDRALESLPERGDLFVATRRIDRGGEEGARLRVLLRHHNPELAGHGRSGLADLDPASNVLEYVLAETVIEASGGRLTIDTTDAQETLILVDLLTPS